MAQQKQQLDQSKMNRSQRNAKAKAKGLRKARRKNKIDKLRNTENKTPTEGAYVAKYRSLNISASTKYMLNPFIKVSRFSNIKNQK